MVCGFGFRVYGLCVMVFVRYVYDMLTTCIQNVGEMETTCIQKSQVNER